MTNLSDLIARVRSATGPDRELDAEIMFDLFAVPVGKKEDGGPTGYLCSEDNLSWSFGIRFPGRDRAWFQGARNRTDGETLVIERDGANVLMNALRIPKLTASLDAAVALCERVLPGWWWRVGTCHISDDATIGPDYNSPEHGERLRREFPIGVKADGYPDEWIFDVDQRPPRSVALALILAVLLAKQEIDRVQPT